MVNNNEILGEKEIKKSKKSFQQIDKVLSEFRKIYKHQLGSDMTVKSAALQKAIENKCTGAYTVDVFHQEVAERIDLLLSSAHFQEAMQEKGLDPFNAASHFVLLGWQKLEDCILRGGYNAIQSFKEWKEPMFDRKTMEDYNPHMRKVLEASEEKAA